MGDIYLGATGSRLCGPPPESGPPMGPSAERRAPGASWGTMVRRLGVGLVLAAPLILGLCGCHVHVTAHSSPASRPHTAVRAT